MKQTKSTMNSDTETIVVQAIEMSSQQNKRLMRGAWLLEVHEYYSSVISWMPWNFKIFLDVSTK